MGWIRCVRCKKLQRDFMARTFAFIAPVQYVLQQVSCSYKNDPKCTQILRNIPKHYIRVKGLDWDCPVRKIPTSLRGTNFCINCTSSPRFVPSFMQFGKDPKCTQTLCNTPKNEFMVQCGDWVRSLRKIPTSLRGTNLCINCTS